MNLALTSDLLSPMLVKELRQGIKSKGFMFAFLLMQGLMVFCVLMYLTAVVSEHDASSFNTLFWFCLGATLIVITPLRAMGALNQEIKSNTIELIFLTRLGAWRIVAGKWLALFWQALLLTSGALPYLIFRYYFGGVNIADDLLVLFYMLLGSAVLTAVGVCLSAFSLWLRAFVVVGVIILSVSLIAMSVRSSLGGPFAGTPPMDLFWASVLALIRAVLIVLLAIAWGASRIAPPAENFAIWKRLLSVAIIALLAVTHIMDETMLLLSGLVIVIPMCSDALGELPRFIPSIYIPFARRGFFGRLAGALLYPGWPAGVFFTLILCGIFSLIAFTGRIALNDHKIAMFAALPGALLFPLALVLTFKPRTEKVMKGYLAFQIAFIVLTIVGGILHDEFSSISLIPLTFFPPCAFILNLVEQREAADWIALTACVSVLSLSLLLIRMRPVFAKIRELERAAAGPPQQKFQ